MPKLKHPFLLNSWKKCSFYFLYIYVSIYSRYSEIILFIYIQFSTILWFVFIWQEPRTAFLRRYFLPLESIPRNRYPPPMQPGGQVRQPYSYPARFLAPRASVFTKLHVCGMDPCTSLCNSVRVLQRNTVNRLCFFSMSI